MYILEIFIILKIMKNLSNCDKVNTTQNKLLKRYHMENNLSIICTYLVKNWYTDL